MQAINSAKNGIARGYGFFKRQERDWRVSVFRSNTHIFMHRIIDPYLSIYIIALGATATQLGLINSIGMIVGGLVAPVLGSLIDRIGVKKVYLITIFFVAVAYLLYGIAGTWVVAIIAMVAFWLGHNPSLQACGVICANSLSSSERATGMALCETSSMGVLGIFAPMLGALLVTAFGGINVDGIRPIFFICMAFAVITFILIFTQLSNRKWGSVNTGVNLSFFKGISEVFKKGRYLKRWIMISTITSLPMGMAMPFRQVFAHDIKDADQYILGMMVMASSIVPIILGIFMGRMADKLGRKKLIYASMPFVWLSNIILIWAPDTAWLVVAGALQGFFMLSGLPERAMSRELVPPEQMGRWLGILDFCKMIFSAGSVYLAGIIWDNVGPQYVFLIIIATDILIRIPLMLGMPETLNLDISQNGENN
ncbi:MFS transporter [Chloroflexota bacterium]